MYYEEQTINGILCYRTSPNGCWEIRETGSCSYMSWEAVLQLVQKEIPNAKGIVFAGGSGVKIQY